MKFIPILFSTPMVQAILDERKTQTRRIVKEQILGIARPGEHKCPYGQPGDVLWVRETFQTWRLGYIHKATWSTELPENIKWKPGIHMPKEACRLFLEIVSVRVERLQDISEQDAISEGVKSTYVHLFQEERYKDYHLDVDGEFRNPVTSFKTLWESINGEDSWESNPWVWVIEFMMTERPKNFIV